MRMAPQWLTCCMTVLLLWSHVAQVVPQTTSCSIGAPGIPGIPGSPGAAGRDGVRGEKGDAGELSDSVKGQKGEPGLRGPPGRPGLKGNVGLPGRPGAQGYPGPKGQSFGNSHQQKPLFSHSLKSQVADVDTPIDFSGVFLPDLDPRFQSDSLAAGSFTCATKGVYFFSYHISARSRVCIRLTQSRAVSRMLCDTADGFLVTSGSALLELEAGDRVALEASRYNSILWGQDSTSSAFTGFLVFSTA